MRPSLARRVSVRMTRAQYSKLPAGGLQRFMFGPGIDIPSALTLPAQACYTATVFEGNPTMRTTTDRITNTPGVCGGRACIRNTRITVWGLVAHRRLGMSDDAILASIPGLKAEDLQAALEYAAAHPAEIDEDIRLNTEA